MVKCAIKLFADDTKLYVRSDIKEQEELLQEGVFFSM